ncbi:hypothetical protein BJV82DRAFT_666162 [Fennellomyces sp. T-0311]|nr:hypothetical protein BJV82DRAFT_666162 [Fennellomyces sp. T-0311]
MALVGHYLNKQTVPKEVVPLLVFVGSAVSAGVVAGVRKLRKDPDIRKQGHQQWHPK